MKILLLASIIAAGILPTPVAADKTMLQCAIEFLIFSCHYSAVGICSTNANWRDQVGIKFSARIAHAQELLAMLIWKGNANEGVGVKAETLSLRARDPNFRRLAFTAADNSAPTGQNTFATDCEQHQSRLGACLTALLSRAATADGKPANTLAEFRTLLGAHSLPTNPIPPPCQ